MLIFESIKKIIRIVDIWQVLNVRNKRICRWVFILYLVIVYTSINEFGGTKKTRLGDPYQPKLDIGKVLIIILYVPTPT